MTQVTHVEATITLHIFQTDPASANTLATISKSFGGRSARVCLDCNGVLLDLTKQLDLSPKAAGCASERDTALQKCILQLSKTVTEVLNEARKDIDNEITKGKPWPAQDLT